MSSGLPEPAALLPLALVAVVLPFLDHAGPLAFAHRGGAGDWPENTMPAFEDAVAMGYRYLETDVHLTSDGVVVAFHDESLDRVTDRRGLIGDHGWDNLARARVGGRERIPRLEELLDAFPEARINIDTKSDAVVDPLITLLRRTGSVDRVCIGSFSDERLRRVADALGPEACLALGPRAIFRFALRSVRMPVRHQPGPCLQVPTHWNRVPVVTNRFVARAQEHGMHVHVWTIDEPDEMHRLLDMGVDGIMTDRPAVLKSVLVERGAWVDSP